MDGKTGLIKIFSSWLLTMRGPGVLAHKPAPPLTLRREQSEPRSVQHPTKQQKYKE